MKTTLYKFVTLIVIFSMLLNAMPPQTALAQAASPQENTAENTITAQDTNLVVNADTGGEQNVLVSNAPGLAKPPVLATPEPITVVQIPAGGGKARSPKGDFSFTFSPAFGKAFSARLQAIAVTGSAPSRALRPVGSAYAFRAAFPNGAAIDSFAPQPPPTQDSDKNSANNFTITVKYTDADVWELDETTLGVYAREAATGKWLRLPSLPDPAANLVVAQADQPGDFAVFAERKALAAAAPAKNVKLVLDPDDDLGFAYWNGVRYSELPFSARLAGQVSNQLATDSCTVDVLLTRETSNPAFLSRTIRKQQAVDFGADMFVTLAFDSFNDGQPWGVQSDGGMETWARSNHPDDDALTSQLGTFLTQFTGRRHKPTFHPAIYATFDGLPASMTYAHSETLYLSHNYDWPIIRDHFDWITNAVYSAIRTQLETKGMVCKSGNPLPKPPSAEELQHMRDLGYQNYLQYGADPVSFSTGNHVVKRSLFSLPEQGNTTFNFGLVYNSQDTREGYFGVGWSAPIPYVQLYSDDSVTVTLADGRTYYFTPNGSGYNIPADLHVTLARTSDGWQWTNADGSTMTFVEAAQGFGPMTESRDRHGNTYKYEYDFQGQAAGNLRPNLLKITDTAGRVINFQSDADGHITSITLPGNRAYQLEYTNTDLTKISDPNGGAYRYEYDNRDRIVKQWDPQGYLFLQNQYDDQDRVIGQIDASGKTLTLAYKPGVTTYTDNLGNVSEYSFDSQNRVTSIKDALGFTTNATYDAQDNVLERSDKRGNHFTFTYDSKSNPLTASGPEGYSASYTYNSFGDLTSMTDHGGPNGQARATSFTVNGQGDIEAVHYPDGTSLQMTYDAHGNLQTSKDENGAVISYTYDGQGNLTQKTDPLGSKTNFTYDAAGRKTGMTDANGHAAQFSYDANNNITKITDPKGNATSFSYDKNDNLVKMVDRRGGVSLFAYDENLKLASESDPVGNTTRYAYDAAYNLVSVTDPLGHVTRYGYNARYEVEQVTAANGGITHFAYDRDGNVTQVTDALNQVTRFEYNGLNLPTARTDPLNGRTSLGYDAVGRLVDQTNPRGAKTTFIHDLRDRVVEIQDALQHSSKIAYDLAGNPVRYTDANGHTTALQYDVAGRLASSTDAANQVTRFQLDGVGNLKQVTDALGRVTAYSYDANDNVVAVTDALGKVTHFGYDQEDNLKAARDARGNLSLFAYDLNGQMIQMTEAGGQVSKFVYDGNRNLKQFTNAKGNSWSFGYNALNQRASETDPLQHTTQYRYDLLGQMTTVTDPSTSSGQAGIATRYDYDALGHLADVVQNNSSAPADFQTNVTTRYTYDEAGNLASSIDANGNVTSYTYDLLDRLTQEKNALNNTWRYAYDPKGNRTERTDANGDKTAYSYTVTDLLAKIDYPDHTHVDYAYDAVGNQTSASTSQLGTITNQYDALNRLIVSTDSAKRTIRYAYDAAGNQTAITYPDGKTARYAYDRTNYLSKVTDPQGNVTKFTRDQTHNAIRIDNPNQTLAIYAFDKAERLKAVTNLHTNGKLINSFVYKLDEVGNRTETQATYAYEPAKRSQLTSAYQYDPLYRLTRSSDSAGRQSVYSYDAVGNRTRLATNFNPSPTDSSDLDAGKKPAGLTLNYSYDAINALTKITQGDATRDLGKVTASLNAFIEEVKAQSGKQIVPQTADALTQAATAIVNQIPGAPDQKTLAASINALSQQVDAARKAKQIKSEGVAKSLQAELKQASDANDQSKPKPNTTQETDFSYDKNGNRIEELVLQARPRDAAVENGKKDARIQYQYDFENRLVSVRGDLPKGDAAAESNGQPKIDTSMTYDAYGRLFERRTHPGIPGSDAVAGRDNRPATQFVYDGLDPIAEYTGSGLRHDGSDSAETESNNIKHTNYYRGDGRILSMLTNAGAGYAPGRMTYFHYDGLNSVTAVTGHKGQAAHGYQYSDFGVILDNNGKAQDSSSFTDPHNHYTYTGQEWDETTNLYHFYAREYDPATGTWLQQDPYRGQMSAPVSMHRYGYTGNNPITFADRHGYGWLGGIIGGVVGAIVGAVGGFLVGGIPGAIIGGVVGAAAGAYIGHTIEENSKGKNETAQNNKPTPSSTPTHTPTPSPTPTPRYLDKSERMDLVLKTFEGAYSDKRTISLLLAIAARESGDTFDNNVNADGIMQVNWGPSKSQTSYNNTEHDIKVNVSDGLRIFDNYNKGNIIKAAWKYNGGGDPYTVYSKKQGDPKYVGNLADKLEKFVAQNFPQYADPELVKELRDAQSLIDQQKY